MMKHETMERCPYRFGVHTRAQRSGMSLFVTIRAGVSCSGGKNGAGGSGYGGFSCLHK